ncbi:MAG: phosphate ABC transporter permease PstA [Acidobacteriota bacterium]
MTRRATFNALFQILVGAAALLCCLILLFLLLVIGWNGIHAISPEFLLSRSRGFGAEGGILYQVLGSILLLVFAALISFSLALGTAIYYSEYLKSSLPRKLSATLIYSLNGVPSVIFGIFGLIFFVNILGTGVSWLVGSVILAVMILPTVTLASWQSLDSIPRTYRESASALGLSKWAVIVRVVLPQGVHGAITGLLIGLARAIGETAPIMFIATAFSGVDVPASFFEPVTALPTHILALTQQATHAKALRNAWGASPVLLCLVLLLSLFAYASRLKLGALSRR